MLSVKTVIFCYNRTSVPFWWGTKAICNTCWFQRLHQDLSSHVGDSFSPQTRWLFSAESKLIAKILTARAQRQKFWHSSLCIRKSTHVLGSDPSRIPVWNTIWNHLENWQWEYSEQTLALVSSGHTGILACSDRRPGARSPSCEWVRQFSLSRDITWINKLKTGHVELSGKVCVQCAHTQPQASHPASKYFLRLT